MAVVRFIKIAGVAVLGVVLLIVVGAGGFMAYYAMQPKTFDECVVAEMRGQDQSVIGNVRAVCERRFSVLLEVALPAGQWGWTYENGAIEIITKVPFSITYELSRVDVQLSPKACDATGSSDWSSTVGLYGGDYYNAKGIYSGEAACLRIQQAYARRR